VSDLGLCRQLDTCRQLDALLYVSTGIFITFYVDQLKYTRVAMFVSFDEFRLSLAISRIREEKVVNQISNIKNQESRIENPESSMKDQNSKIKNQKSKEKIKDQKSGNMEFLCVQKLTK
jgi:CRISPR/Cas system-associated endonuclease Cas1